MDGSGHRRFDQCDGEPSRVDVDTALRLLSDPLCRFLVGQLVHRSGESTNVEDLVDRYVERAAGGSHESVEVQCRHAHLPALESAGVIDFDDETGEIRYHPDPFVEELVEVIERWEA